MKLRRKNTTLLLLSPIDLLASPLSSLLLSSSPTSPSPSPSPPPPPPLPHPSCRIPIAPSPPPPPPPTPPTPPNRPRSQGHIIPEQGAETTTITTNNISSQTSQYELWSSRRGHCQEVRPVCLRVGTQESVTNVDQTRGKGKPFI